MTEGADDHDGGGFHLPDPTPWPFVMAAGAALLVAGFIYGPKVTLVRLMVEKEVFKEGGGGKPEFAISLGVLSLLGLAVFFLALYRLIREDIVPAWDGQPLAAPS